LWHFTYSRQLLYVSSQCESFTNHQTICSRYSTAKTIINKYTSVLWTTGQWTISVVCCTKLGNKLLPQSLHTRPSNKSYSLVNVRQHTVTTQTFQSLFSLAELHHSPNRQFFLKTRFAQSNTMTKQLCLYWVQKFTKHDFVRSLVILWEYTFQDFQRSHRQLTLSEVKGIYFLLFFNVIKLLPTEIFFIT